MGKLTLRVHFHISIYILPIAISWGWLLGHRYRDVQSSCLKWSNLTVGCFRCICSALTLVGGQPEFYSSFNHPVYLTFDHACPLCHACVHALTHVQSRTDWTCAMFKHRCNRLYMDAARLTSNIIIHSRCTYIPVRIYVCSMCMS